MLNYYGVELDGIWCVLAVEEVRKLYCNIRTDVRLNTVLLAFFRHFLVGVCRFLLGEHIPGPRSLFGDC